MVMPAHATLADHVAEVHDTPRNLIGAISFGGLVIIHTGAHTTPAGKPDGESAHHVNTGRDDAETLAALAIAFEDRGTHDE